MNPATPIDDRSPLTYFVSQAWVAIIGATASEGSVGRTIARNLLAGTYIGPEFVAKELRQWLAKLGTGTLYIEPESSWENRYCDSFGGKQSQ